MQNGAGGRAPWLALTAGLLCTGIVHAQSWLPSAGSSDLTLAYVDTITTKHYLADGSEVDAGHIRTFTYALGAEYSPTDRWMLSASLPLIESAYSGSSPHPTYVDHGGYHATITDLRTEAHFQWLLQPLAVAPYVAYVLPTHDYETLGHAAPGRGLDEFWVGVALGKHLDRWIPRTYIDTRFTYAFVQAVQHISHDKENVEINVGYFFTPYLSMQGMWHWQQTLGGIGLPVPKTNPLFWYHDQLAAADYTAVGGSVGWSYSDQTYFSLSYLTDLMGRNGHKIDATWAVTYNYEFGPHY